MAKTNNTKDVTSTARVETPSGIKTIITDNQKSAKETLGEKPSEILPAPPIAPLRTIKSGFDTTVEVIPAFVVTSDIKTSTMSAESSRAPFETIFNDFNLECFPAYNFYESDELTNDKDPVGERNLEDVPRFIRLVWNAAPDLQKKTKSINPKLIQSRFINPVKFGLEIDNQSPFLRDGIKFLPDHLQPQNFSLVKNSLANDILGSGIINAIVESVDRTRSIGTSVSISHPRIDEETYLSSPAFDGISIHELDSNNKQASSGITGLLNVLSETKDSDLSGELFDGRFSVERPVSGDAPLTIRGIQSSSPALGLGVTTTSNNDMFKLVNDLRTVWAEQGAIGAKKLQDAKNDEERYIAVKFADTVIDGVVSQENVNLLNKPEHAENTVSIAHVLPQLEIFSRTGATSANLEIPSFQSPPGLKVLEYVGYVIEKYKKTSSGAFVKVDEIDIPNRDYTQFVDAKIIYGEIYRYRIKSIVRWTRPNNVNPFGEDKSTTYSRNAISQFKSSYFGSEWCHKWVYGTTLDTLPPSPPDELTVRPDSAKQVIHVTMKFPENLQKDIRSMALLRKVRTKSNEGPWKMVLLAGEDPQDKSIQFQKKLQNVHYLDTDVAFSSGNDTTYIYAGVCYTVHNETSKLSEQLGARLNSNHAAEGELMNEFISCSGVDIDDFGAFSVCPPRRNRSEIIVIPVQRTVNSAKVPATINMSGREAVGSITLNSGNYIVRLESLDTGEKKDLDLTVNYITEKTRVN